jgi:hypothetical protein
MPIDLEQDGDSFTVTLDFRKVALRDEGEVSVTLRPVSPSQSQEEFLSGNSQTTYFCQLGLIRMERAPDGIR